MAFSFDDIRHIPHSYLKWIIIGGTVLVHLVIFRSLWRRLSRYLRRRRPPQIHPRLQKYNVDHAELDRERREQSARILATSTGALLAGYRIVRQVDAIFVEGCRTPEDAIIALKALAAERGGNALVNVKTERTSAGKCIASGDAVLAAAPSAPPANPPNSPNFTKHN